MLNNKKNITAWLDKHKVQNYTLVEDDKYGFVVDVAGSVALNEKGLTFIDVKFNQVSGHFDCQDNQLKSLEGVPNFVGKFFNCSRNQLVSLEGGPTTVGDEAFCANNQLTNLVGAPQKVGHSFHVQHNNLNSLDDCPQVGVEVFIAGNPQLSRYPNILTPEQVSAIIQAHSEKEELLSYHFKAKPGVIAKI